MKKLVVVVLLLAAVLLCNAVVHALTGAIPGAIYWPAYSVNTGSSSNEQASLSQTSFQSRAPWYCDFYYPQQISCAQTQTHMDKELQLAAASGIKYFAFVWYGDSSANGGPPGNSSLQTAWNLYQSSSYKTVTSWALIVGPGYLGTSSGFSSNTNKWQANVNALVALMSQSSYQKVLTDRPIIYILYSSSELTTYFEGSQANLATAINYLKSQVDAVTGLGPAHVAVMNIGTGASAVSTLSTIAGDSLTNYFNGGVSFFRSSTAVTNTYANYDSLVQAYWTTQASGSAPSIVPILQIGGDFRARKNMPPPWEATNTNMFTRLGHSLYWVTGTPAEIAAGQITGIGAFMDANAGITSHKTFLIYAWTEKAEAWPTLQPERGDPPQTEPPYTGGASTGLTNMLNAIGPILWGYR